MIILSFTWESGWSQGMRLAAGANEPFWVPQFSHELGDSCMLYQGINLPQKGTAKENNCPGRQARERKYLWDWGGIFSRRKSIENLQLTVPQVLINFPYSTTPTSIQLTRGIITWYHMGCNPWWYSNKGMLWEEKWLGSFSSLTQHPHNLSQHCARHSPF